MFRSHSKNGDKIMNVKSLEHSLCHSKFLINVRYHCSLSGQSLKLLPRGQRRQQGKMH